MKITHVIEEVDREVVFVETNKSTVTWRYGKIFFIIALAFTLWYSLNPAIHDSSFSLEVFINKFILVGGNFVLLFIFLRKARSLFKSYNFVTAFFQSLKSFIVIFCAGGLIIKFIAGIICL